jgi:taurine dioxygenase
MLVQPGEATHSANPAIEVSRLSGVVGAEVADLDLAGPDIANWRDSILELLAEYGVVIFPRQSLTQTQFRTFASVIGNLAVPETLSSAEGVEDNIQVLSTSNGAGYRSDIWHADDTPNENPTRFTFVHMQQIPPAGGDTMWSSQIAAFKALSPSMQRWLRGLTARHSNSIVKLSESRLKSADHPVVCTHPLSGRPSLFVNSLFTQRINELNETESNALLTFLFEHAATIEFTCRWHWNVGDVAVWENHFVQHYAVHDYGDWERKIHRLKAQPERPIPAPIG